MMKAEETNERIRCIEKHENHPMVAEILIMNSTFKKEIGRFYDLSWNMEMGVSKIGIIETFNLKKENPQKKGKCPVILIEILKNFSAIKMPLDANKLVYDSVRENCRKWNIKAEKAAFTNFIPFLRAFTGTRYPELTDEENGYVNEYMRLYYCALNADNFMDTYRKYFIKKTLSQKSN